MNIPKPDRGMISAVLFSGTVTTDYGPHDPGKITYHATLFDGDTAIEEVNLTPANPRYTVDILPAKPGDVFSVIWIGNQPYYMIRELEAFDPCKTGDK